MTTISVPQIMGVSSGYQGPPQVWPEVPTVIQETRIPKVDMTILIANGNWLSPEGKSALEVGDRVRFITQVEIDGYDKDLIRNQDLDWSQASQGFYEFEVYCTRYKLVKIDPMSMKKLDQLRPGASSEFLRGIEASAEDRRVELCMDYLFPMLQGSVYPGNSGPNAAGNQVNLGDQGTPLVFDNVPVNGIYPVSLILNRLKMAIRYADPDGWVDGDMFAIVPAFTEMLLASMAPVILQANTYADFPFLALPVRHFQGFNLIMDTREMLLIQDNPRVHEIIAGNPSATIFACSGINPEYFPNTDGSKMHDAWRSIINFGGKVLKPKWLAAAVVSIRNI